MTLPGMPPPYSAPYDPRLKLVAEEIKAVLKKHNMAGALALASDTHSEFVLSFPTWSGLSFANGEMRIKLRAKEPAKWNATVHALFQLRDLSARNFASLDQLSNMVLAEAKKNGTVITHKAFSGFHPDRGSSSGEAES